MTGDGHVPFRGSLGVKLPGATRPRPGPVGRLVEASGARGEVIIVRFADDFVYGLRGLPG